MDEAAVRMRSRCKSFFFLSAELEGVCCTIRKVNSPLILYVSSYTVSDVPRLGFVSCKACIHTHTHTRASSGWLPLISHIFRTTVGWSVVQTSHPSPYKRKKKKKKMTIINIMTVNPSVSSSAHYSEHQTSCFMPSNKLYKTWFCSLVSSNESSAQCPALISL